MEHEPAPESPYKDLNNFVLSLPGSGQRDQMEEMGLADVRIGDVEENASPAKQGLTYRQWHERIDTAITESGGDVATVKAAVERYLKDRTDGSFRTVSELVMPAVRLLLSEGFSDFDIKG